MHGRRAGVRSSSRPAAAGSSALLASGQSTSMPKLMAHAAALTTPSRHLPQSPQWRLTLQLRGWLQLPRLSPPPAAWLTWRRHGRAPQSGCAPRHRCMAGREQQASSRTAERRLVEIACCGCAAAQQVQQRAPGSSLPQSSAPDAQHAELEAAPHVDASRLQVAPRPRIARGAAAVPPAECAGQASGMPQPVA